MELLATLSGHKEGVWDVAYSPSGSYLASCSTDRTVRIWGQENGKWVCKTILDGAHERTIRSLAWSPCGNLLASASFDGTICIWDRRRGAFECCATLEGHDNEVKSVAWSASGSSLATCGRDKSVWIWSCKNDDDDEYECASVLQSHSQDVKSVVWHPTLEILASASYDDTIKLYHEDQDDWSCYQTLTGHSSTVWALDFDSYGDHIVSCSDDRTLKIWQCRQPTGLGARCISTIAGFFTRPIYDVSWSKISGLIASSGGDNSIKVFRQDPSTTLMESPVFELHARNDSAHSQDVNAIQWSPASGTTLASASDDGSVKIWSVSS